MSTVTVAIIAENAVILVAIVTAGHLFRQGGGWQWKTPPVPKAPPQPKRFFFFFFFFFFRGGGTRRCRAVRADRGEGTRRGMTETPAETKTGGA